MDNRDESQIKVIIGGLSRCGTFSLKTAIMQLGYVKCYHFSEFMANPSHAPYWNDLTDGKEIQWNELFKGYQAVSDVPCITHIDKIIKAYPKAKVILNSRDFESWYASAKEIIFDRRDVWNESYPHTVKADNYFLDVTLEGKYYDKEYMREFFKNYYEKIKSLVPEDQILLNYEVKQGWDPLCKFLELEVPSQPFPCTNDREKTIKNIESANLFLN